MVFLKTFLLLLIESFFHIPKCRILLQKSLKIQIIKYLFCNFIYYTLSDLERSLKMHIFMHEFCNNLFQICFNKLYMHNIILFINYKLIFQDTISSVEVYAITALPFIFSTGRSPLIILKPFYLLASKPTTKTQDVVPC